MAPLPSYAFLTGANPMHRQRTLGGFVGLLLACIVYLDEGWLPAATALPCNTQETVGNSVAGAPTLKNLQIDQEARKALKKALETTVAIDEELAGDFFTLVQPGLQKQVDVLSPPDPKGSQPTWSGAEALCNHLRNEASMTDKIRFAFQGTGFGTMLYAMYLLFVRSPNPRAEWSVGVNRVFGKLIFLTTQAVCLLTAYFGLGFVSEGFNIAGHPLKRLDATVHVLAPVAGGFGYFLTIMFYALVWGDRSFQEGAVLYWETRGVPFGRWQHWIHATSLPLVLLDAFAKRAAGLNAAILPTVSYAKGCFLFSCWYTSLIRLNFRLTGKWPYPFLSNFTQAWKHWLFYVFSFANILSFTFIHRAVLLSVSRMQLAYAEIRNASPLLRRDDVLVASGTSPSKPAATATQ